jgi:hypothetical protein
MNRAFPIILILSSLNLAIFPKRVALKFLNFLNKQAGGPHDDLHFLQTSP